ncbi:hypothetical protein [Solibacillus sp. CAU 1738]|uniref:hypothetical protein n=1 Tax=Solibacillus sp. CAU 1738 TaxID=3140363 RepID=UPI0032617629
MKEDLTKLLEAKMIIEKLANGVNPIDQSQIDSSHFLNDSKIIRSLFYLVNYLNDEISNSKIIGKPKRFIITEEQIAKIQLPTGKLGLNDFAAAVNEVIDPLFTKKLSGAIVSKKLKELAILSETVNEDGRKRTVTNEISSSYGIEMITRFYDGRPYNQVVFDELGKEFLLNNLNRLFE